jgi:putative inorganic carbon (HCO3(-)) transporter
VGQLGLGLKERPEPRVLALGGGLLLAASMVGVLSGADPKLGLVAAVGVAFVFLVLANLAAGVYVFAVVAFLDILPFGGAAVTFSKAVGVLLALSWLAVLVTRDDGVNDFVSDRPGLSLILIGLITWALLSVYWAEDAGAGLAAVYRYGLNVALFLIIYTAIRTRRNAVWLIAAFLTGAVISALYGIAGPAPLASQYDLDRAGGAGIDSNELAALLVAALALAAAFAAGWRKSPLVLVSALAVIVCCVAGVFLSLSRGGLIALGVALIAAVVFGGRWRTAAAGLALCLALGTVAYFSVVATPEQRERVTQLDGGTGRSDIWTVGWRMVEAEPIIGVGAGNFPIASIHFLLEPGVILRDEFIVDEPKVAHNMYLEALAELGIVGLLLFLSVLGFSLASALRAARRFMHGGDARMELLARAVAVALLGLLAADFFVSDQFSKQLWLLLALGPALDRIAEAQPSPPPAGPESRARSRPVPAYA